MNTDGTLSYRYYRAKADYITFAEYVHKEHQVQSPKFWKLFGTVPKTDEGALRIWLELFEQKAVLTRRGLRIGD